MKSNSMHSCAPVRILSMLWACQSCVIMGTRIEPWLLTKY